MSGSGKLTPLVGEYARSAELVRVLRLLDLPRAHLGGFAGASPAFFLAAWERTRSGGAGGPHLVVTATQEEADQLVEELETFASVPVSSFPAWESLFLPDSVPDGEIFRQRLDVVRGLHASPVGPRLLVAPVQAVIQPVPSAEALRESRIVLRVGAEERPDALAERMARLGLRTVTLVEGRGEFSARGDILDVFPYEGDHPLRIEFFGDTVESIRAFEAESQRSIKGGERSDLEICSPPRRDFFRDSLRENELLVVDLLGPNGKLVLVEPAAVEERAAKILGNIHGDATRALGALRDKLSKVSRLDLTALPVAGGHGGDEADGEAWLEVGREAGFAVAGSVAIAAAGSAAGGTDRAPGANLRFHSVERFRGSDLDAVFAGISERIDAGYRFEITCESPAEMNRFLEILRDHDLADRRGLVTRVGPVRRGFEIGALSAVILTTREIFQRHIVRRVRRKGGSSRAIQSFFELEKGDGVVHLVHGIGRYMGIESFERNGVLEEFLAIEYRGNVKVYVPVSKIDLVQKYIGSGDRPVILDKVGGTSWARKKEDVERALLDLASDLVELQARRRACPGFSYPPASEWQRQFEAAFQYEETPDQVEVTQVLHQDMEASRPMDRLICGDVGYGKTELAMRATFKAIDAGKQVAVLVPTTVLAQQHLRTFTERMSGFPIRIDVLSRFRTPAEQRDTIEKVASGGIDVLIGTHRLLSDDVGFRDLGLLIIDEEQRFGVAHKEKLKRLRSTVDVLTLTATPIPRTLHMSLLGIRDISGLTTAPEGRCPVRTELIPFERRRIREIMIRELNRDGQIYFVHNRIHDIERVSAELRALVPEARIAHAHGQMDEGELEEKMLGFFEGEFDCLISTTIIESGLDIPNVNTIFIDDADRYGLADLHQLRGRVGRDKHQAYCYLIVEGGRSINPEAQRRLQAIVEFSDLGAGFQIAMRDLEIRGAGNILGPQQSGHIAAVGYDMYCRLLEKAVRRIRQEPFADAEPVGVEIDLAIPARVPDDYRPGEAAKIAVYRRIASAAAPEAVDDLVDELEDRFGPCPPEVLRLLDVQRLRLLAARRGVESIGRDGNNVILKGREEMRELLEGSSARIVVLDARTVAVALTDPRRRYPPVISDERVFQTVLEWFRAGTIVPPAAFPAGPQGSSSGAGARKAQEIHAAPQ